MLLNVIAIFLLITLAAYLGNQGVLSSLLAFIAAAFGSILAGTLFEPLQGIVGGYRPDYARGVTFLVLFLVAFSACRFAADFAIPKNIKIPNKTINKAVGGLFGFLASMIIVGSLLIGLQMLPLGSSILGYNRFPGENGMQGDEPGTVAAGSNIWLAPDRFTVALWNLASGRSLGGDRPFKSIHPDFVTESYGYRNTVQSGVTLTLPPDLLKVDSTWVSSDAAVLKAFNITEPGKSAAVIRLEVTSSNAAPKISVDPAASGTYFFITPSEVRLVTNQGRQHYPIGYLEKGRQFVPTPLDSGQLADDFPEGKSSVVEEWVFQIDSDETPQTIEVKELARAPLTRIQDKPVALLASNLYPPRAYRQSQGAIQITSSGFAGMRIEWFKVYVINKTTNVGKTRSLFADPYATIVEALQQINNSSGIWFTTAGKPGVPTTGDLNTAYRIIQEYKNDADDQAVDWDNLVPYLFVGKSTTDGTQNLLQLPQYFQQTLVPYFTSTILLKQGDVDASGQLTLSDLPKGQLDVIAGCKTDRGFYVWAIGEEIKPKTTTDVTLTPSNAPFKAVLK